MVVTHLYHVWEARGTKRFFSRGRVFAAHFQDLRFFAPLFTRSGRTRPWKMAAKKRTSITNDSVMMYKWIVKLDFLRTIELGELLVKRSGRHAAAGIVLQRFRLLVPVGRFQRCVSFELCRIALSTPRNRINQSCTRLPSQVR